MRAVGRLGTQIVSTFGAATNNVGCVVFTTLLLLQSATTLRAEALDTSHQPRNHLGTMLRVARIETNSNLERPAALRYATDPGAPINEAPADARIRALGFDPSHIRDAITAYRADHLDVGDVIAAGIGDPVVRTALEWVALRNVPQSIGFDRLDAFGSAHADWPAAGWVRHQMEARLIRAQDPLLVARFFTEKAPETVPGKLALAKALKLMGRTADGTKLARAVFRENTLSPSLETWLKTEFGNELTKGDYRYRAERLLYQGHAGTATRFAARAGSDVLALARARAAALHERPSDKTMAAVPVAWRNDPGLRLAEARRLRHQNKLILAAQLLRTVTRDQALRVDGDEWWTERRALARELLDAGKPNAAYITCALHTAGSREAEIDAEFHAGWIALRFLHDTERATYHFWAAAKLTETPTSIARIAYWQGRTAEAATDPDVKARAHAFYEKAAVHGATYYGQLARQVLGLSNDTVQEAVPAAIGTDRLEAVRIVELLYAAGDRESASALAMEIAASLSAPNQVAALADVIGQQHDAHLALTIGKVFALRGISVDPLAFPTFGIPPYKELANSAPAPIVYSVARQESAFTSNAISGAGAKGLMQMIASTARHTASKAGVHFTTARLLHDASFNAQLGAAHLGALIAEHKGSLILTFAAYNAGGGRVQDWIEAYGDPRKPGVDPIDWVERIPFGETRNYVQKVMANVTVYTAIFADQEKKNLMARAAGEARL